VKSLADELHRSAAVVRRWERSAVVPAHIAADMLVGISSVVLRGHADGDR